MGIWEHGRDYALLERESFDFVDDCAWYFQLVLRRLLRAGEMKGGVALEGAGRSAARKFYRQLNWNSSIPHAQDILRARRFSPGVHLLL